jgi:uncharacterized membrane protein
MEALDTNYPVSVKVGVALFIVLLAARVALMLLMFLRERNYAFSLISALVLTIIAAGFLLGAVTNLDKGAKRLI